MKAARRTLAELERVYVVRVIELAGREHFLAATEDHGPCLLFSPPDWSASVAWPGPGGCMTLSPVPGRAGAVVAVEKFFPVFQSEEAGIAYAEPGADPTRPWNVRRVIDLPFVHRCEAVEHAGVSWIIAAALCAGKERRDDWSQPGAVYAGLVPDDPAGEWSIEPLRSGITKNHGMWVHHGPNGPTILVSGMEGVFSFRPPDCAGGEWTSEQMLDHEVSDMALADVDGDGVDELATIEPFHGELAAVYRKSGVGWVRAWECEVAFGHVVWAGPVLGEPALILGSRDGDKALSLLRATGTDPLDFERTILAEGVGTTQIAVMDSPDCARILAADHGAAEVSLYTLTP